jgi:hypothetical protein
MGIEDLEQNEMKKETQPLLVTTSHRGVFFGYGIPSDAPTITLTNARMCVYWTADLHGVLGLATRGPGSGCKIGPVVASITLRDVTAVVECSDESVKNWSKEIWS